MVLYSFLMNEFIVLPSFQPANIKTLESFFDSRLVCTHLITTCFPSGSDSKESACNVGDLDSIPGLGRPPGERNGYLLRVSCLENPMDREAWWAAVHGVAQSQTRLSDLAAAAAAVLYRRKDE